MKLHSFLGLCLATLLCPVHAAERPNVLFVSIDDLNDWIRPMGGHPQAKTPNLDKLYKQGAVVFQNAVCAAPVCCPSRSALLSGAMPSSTGVYGNEINMLDSDYVKNHMTMPEYFSKNGYQTISTGKIFHKHATEEGADWGQWAFDTFQRAEGGLTPIKKQLTHQKLGIVNGEKAVGPPPTNSWGALSWGPTVEPFEETVDYVSVAWGKEQLEKNWEKPFFMAIGISHPHLPWYVPQEFFDLYDLDTLTTPEIKEDDLYDIKKPNGQPGAKPAADYLWVKANGIEKEATRAYLASVSYADACLGVLLDGLEKSQYKDNTIIVIWGDHGYHLGEKLRYQKSTLWREAVRMPLIVRLPGMDVPVECQRPVSLIDLYPTLIELCGLPKKELDGHDFSPLLKNPGMKWERPGITVGMQGTSVLTEDHHYLENLSGVREFYDLRKDPMEWTNLIDSPEYAPIITKLAEYVPNSRAEEVKARKAPKKNKKYNAPLDETLKATRKLSGLK
ncbi:MAG: sulfatase [Luteolibacter sp.]